MQCPVARGAPDWVPRADRSQNRVPEPMLLLIAQERHVERRCSHAVEMAAALLAVPAVPPCPPPDAPPPPEAPWTGWPPAA